MSTAHRARGTALVPTLSNHTRLSAAPAVHNPPHNSVPLQLAKLLDQHLLADRGYRPFQVGKAPHLSTKQVEEDYELPSAFQKRERLLDAICGGDGRVPAILSFRCVPSFFVRSCHFVSRALSSTRCNNRKEAPSRSSSRPPLISTYSSKTQAIQRGCPHASRPMPSSVMKVAPMKDWPLSRHGRRRQRSNTTIPSRRLQSPSSMEKLS